jgi:cell division protein FtsB
MATKSAKIWLGRFFSVIVIVAVFFLVLVLAREYYNRRQMDREIIALEQEIAALQNKHGEFLASLDVLDSPAYLEEQARLKLNMKKPAEKVAIIKINDINKIANDSLPKPEAVQPASNLGLWWEYFFGGKNNL